MVVQNFSIIHDADDVDLSAAGNSCFIFMVYINLMWWAG